jgi:hypothetical protein
MDWILNEFRVIFQVFPYYNVEGNFCLYTPFSVTILITGRFPNKMGFIAQSYT